MAVPKRRTSKSRKRSRRTHFKLDVTGLTTCTNCGALIKSHQVCPKCGFYKGKDVINVTEEKEKPKADKKKAKKSAKKAARPENEAAPKSAPKQKVVSKQKTGE